MSIGYSPCTAKYSGRILLKRSYSLRVFAVPAKIRWAYSETTSYIQFKTTPKLPCSPYTLKVFWCILGRRLRTSSPTKIQQFYRILEMYARSKEYTETILHFHQCLNDFKGTVYRKNRMGDYKLVKEQLSTFIFS
jgi:hypothetical protein